MTVTLPPWEAWPLAALTILGASTLAGLATAPILLKRRAGDQPAPGAGPAPAPGPRHRTGGLDYAIRAYHCGCVHLYDGRGALTGCTPCIPASLEDEIKDLLS